MKHRHMIRIAVLLASVVASSFCFSGDSLAVNESELAYFSQDVQQTLELRKDATRALRDFDGPNALIAVSRASKDPDAGMREASIYAAEYWSVIGKWDLMFPLTEDSVLSVRKAALYSLIAHWAQYDESMKQALSLRIDALENVMPAGLNTELELAWIEQSTGQIIQSESRLNGLNAQYQDTRITLGLAKLQLQLTKVEAAKKILLKGIEQFPDEASFHYQLAIIGYEQGNNVEALNHFEQSYELSPNNSHYAYALGIASKEVDPKKSLTLFDIAYKGSGDPIHLYAKCDLLLAIDESSSDCINELYLLAPQEIVEQLVSSYK